MFLYKNKSLLVFFTISALSLRVGRIHLDIASVAFPPLGIDKLAASGIPTQTSIGIRLFKKADVFRIAEQRRINPPIPGGQLLDGEA